MRSKSLAACLALAGLIPAVTSAQEPQKQVCTEIKYFTVNDKTFADLTLKAAFAEDHVRTLSEGTKEKLMGRLKACGDFKMLNTPTLLTFNNQEGICAITDKQKYTTSATIGVKDGLPNCTPHQEEFDFGTTFKVTNRIGAEGCDLLCRFHAERVSLETPQVPLLPILTYDESDENVDRTISGIPSGIIFAGFVEKPKVHRHEMDIALRLQDGDSFMVYLGQTKTQSVISGRLPAFSAIPLINELFCYDLAIPDCEHHIGIVTVRILKPGEAATEAKRMAKWSMGDVPAELPKACCAAPDCPVPTAPLKTALAPAALPSVNPEPITPVRAVEIVAGSFEWTNPQDYPREKILKILLEEYAIACRAGEMARAKVIATHCVELDPTCFAKPVMPNRTGGTTTP